MKDLPELQIMTKLVVHQGRAFMHILSYPDASMDPLFNPLSGLSFCLKKGQLEGCQGTLQTNRPVRGATGAFWCQERMQPSEHVRMHELSIDV